MCTTSLQVNLCTKQVRIYTTMTSTHTSTSYHIIQSYTIIIGNPRYTTIYCNAYRVMFVFCKHSLTQWLYSVLLNTRITQKQEILCSLEMYTGHCRKLVENERLLEETVLQQRGWVGEKGVCVWQDRKRRGHHQRYHPQGLVTHSR